MLLATTTRAVRDLLKGRCSADDTVEAEDDHISPPAWIRRRFAGVVTASVNEVPRRQTRSGKSAPGDAGSPVAQVSGMLHGKVLASFEALALERRWNPPQALRGKEVDHFSRNTTGDRLDELDPSDDVPVQGGRSAAGSPTPVSSWAATSMDVVGRQEIGPNRKPRDVANAIIVHVPAITP